MSYWDAVPAGTLWREVVVVADHAVVLREDEVSHPTDRSGDEPATHIYEVWTDSRDGWGGRGHRVAITDLADEMRDKYAQELLTGDEYTDVVTVDDAYDAYIAGLGEDEEPTLEGIRRAINDCDLYLEEYDAESLFELASEAIREPVVILESDEDDKEAA